MIPPTNPDDVATDPAAVATLYEIARALLSARDASQLHARLVHSGLGALGARSGALFVAGPRGRLKLAFAAGVERAGAPMAFDVDDDGRVWLATHGPFTLSSPLAGRSLGAARDQIRERFDPAWGVGLARHDRLLGMLAFGPRLLDDDTRVPDAPWLPSFVALAADALLGRSDAVPAPVRARRAERSLAELRRAHPPLARLVGESAALLSLGHDLIAIAPQPFPALVEGETGVGKELAARALHELSPRTDGPFETVDCASIPSELIESELFGHVRGAFTGAHKDRRGAFELAHRGTLFLDEIGEMPLPMQTRLLRALQESRFRRVGDERTIDVDVRVVAATNRDLRAEVGAGRFREDLFYRLNVFAVRVPPLRERLEDLGLLMRHFLTRRAAADGAPTSPAIDREVLSALEHHRWPGNVRELANFCAALGVRGRDGRIDMPDIEAVWARQHPGEAPPWATTAVHNAGAWVLQTLRASRFNLVDATRVLHRRKIAGDLIPVGERTALSYYLIGEILRALAAHGGNADRAARDVAGDETLLPRVAGRVREVRERLAAAPDPETAKQAFPKLPQDYAGDVRRAWRAIAGR